MKDEEEWKRTKTRTENTEKEDNILKNSQKKQERKEWKKIKNRQRNRQPYGKTSIGRHRQTFTHVQTDTQRQVERSTDRQTDRRKYRQTKNERKMWSQEKGNK